jgi:hypothetical protein
MAEEVERFAPQSPAWIAIERERELLERVGLDRSVLPCRAATPPVPAGRGWRDC